MNLNQAQLRNMPKSDNSKGNIFKNHVTDLKPNPQTSELKSRLNHNCFT